MMFFNDVMMCLSFPESHNCWQW